MALGPVLYAVLAVDIRNDAEQGPSQDEEELAQVVMLFSHCTVSLRSIAS